VTGFKSNQIKSNVDLYSALSKNLECAVNDEMWW